MKRDCEHGQLARSCDVCHWQQRAERAEGALKDISQYMHIRGDMQDHAMRQITKATQDYLVDVGGWR